MPAGPITGLPGAAAIYTGTCSGHGICFPPNVHANTACGVPCIAVQKKNIAAMDGTNLWAPMAQLPSGPVSPNVLINNIPPILDQDTLVPHPATCTQLVVQSSGNCFNIMVCGTGELCAEDVAGGGSHVRKASATSTSVFINGKRACRVGDPLGPPCLSLISTGSVNVFIGR